jgi:glycerol-3-phosphate acyltransferase PlsY
MTHALALVLAYVIGSFPSAYLTGRLVKGVDLRRRGSGNLGATNVYREVGAVAAVAVLLLDAAKGWVAVALVPRWLSLTGAEWWVVAMGAAAVLGHAKPVFLLWRGGGKGVATAGGVFVALAPIAAAVSVGVFALVVALTRYVSAGSVAAAVVLPVSVALVRSARSPAFVVSLAISMFVVWAHRGNLRRLSAGEEPRIGRPGKTV